MSRTRVLGCGALLALVCLSGCTTLPPPLSAPAQALVVTPLYPLAETERDTGQDLHFIARVTDGQEQAVTDAQLIITLHGGPDDRVIGVLEATPDGEGTYRAGPWPIPYRIAEGRYGFSLAARRGDREGEADGSLRIKPSTSDILLDKYGFWLDAPTLRDIVPTLAAEQGTARDGMILWGGAIPAQHILPDNWIRLSWRSGRRDLSNADAVRRFMLQDVGDLSFIPIRDVGPFEPFRFKGWDAWKVGGRGQFQQNQVEWVVFYAPEVDKTYLIGAAVTQPPAGIDPHAALRDSFEVHPEVHASGVAPEPLPDLLPGAEPISPPLGERYFGIEQPITLRWQPLKELAEDEYYQVAIDYNYGEANPRALFTTHQTQFTLPESLYHEPNCGVFNWQVTLMRRTGTGEGAKLAGAPVSRPSLYRYLEWRYPPGMQAPFVLKCPNAQF